MKKNIRSLWNLASLEEPTDYWNRWYSWLIHSSIDAMKVVERIILIHMVKIANYFTYKITNAKAAIYFKCGNLGIYP